MHRLPRDAAHRPAGDGRHGAQQPAGAWIAVQNAGDPRYAARQLRLHPGDGPRHPGERPAECRRHAPGHDRQQLLGGHSDKRQKLLGGFLLGFALRRQVRQVLHHGVGVDLAHRADLVFQLAFAFQLALQLQLAFAFQLALAEQTAEESAEFALALAFQFALAEQTAD